MKKLVFSFILAFFILISILLIPFTFPNIDCVSADPVSASIPDSWFTSDFAVPSDFYQFMTALSTNASFSSLDEFYVFGSHDSNGYFINIISPSFQFPYTDGSGNIAFFGTGNFSNNSYNINNISSVTFNLTTINSPPSSFEGPNSLVLHPDGSFSLNATFYYRGQLTHGQSASLDFVYKISTLFTPDYSLTGVVVGFDFSVEAFTQWLIDTGKYADLPAYIGTQKLKSFVQFYHDWGSSNSIFVIRLVEWFMHFNIASQTIENRNIIKSTIDRLYQEYKNTAFVQINHDSSILPHHRKNIETNTTDDDLTLVTDDPSDDTLISILRDILRGVISIPNSIYDNTQVIIAKLDQLNHNIIISNNGGASSSTDLNPVLNKMDDIIDVLGSDTVSVEIDQTTKDDTDDFFDDWNLQFTTALNNKFPVASQLRTFFTGFFERCGIDADSDGEVFQYYNPGVLTASSVSRSAGTASEDDIVSDFLGKFDNSDPAFLDDASYHGVPDLSVSVGGQSVSIIDFRIYAKYREKIHFIISFVIWTLYLLHLYKALPQIIGQVADVAVKTSDL